jgi:hypothetical protein
MDKLVLPKERRFFASFNANGAPLFIHSLDPVQQGERSQYLRTIETSFLREDVERIEVWTVSGPGGQIYQTEVFTCYHPDLHFAPCECGCNARVLTTMRNARCEQCRRIRCIKHGKYHYGSGKSLCLDCYSKADTVQV